MPQRARRMTSDVMVVSIYLRTFTTSIGFVNTAATCAANIPVVKDANGPYQLYLCTASRPHAPSTTITLLLICLDTQPVELIKTISKFQKWNPVTSKGSYFFIKKINYQGYCSMKQRRRVKAAVNCCGLTCIKANITMQI